MTYRKNFRGRGTHPDKTFRDPHLYTGVPVDVMLQALPDEVRRSARHRFVGYMDRAPDKCLVIVYQDGRAWPQVVPVWAVTVTRRGAEPPPLPTWCE